MNIYIVDTTDIESDLTVRRIVIATSAVEAVAKVSEHPNDRSEVGRIGTYEPGFVGAAIVEASGSVIVTGNVLS